MKAGWDAVAVVPNVCHKAGNLGDDDVAHSGHQRDLNHWTGSGH